MSTAPEKTLTGGNGVAVSSRPDLAAQLRKSLGQRIAVVWGIGSQKVTETSCGTLQDVTDRSITLRDAKRNKNITIPTRFIVSYA